MSAKEKEIKTPVKTKRIGALLATFFLLLYVPSLFHWVYGEKTEVQLINNGIIEEIIPIEAYIVRDEEVLKSPLTGRCILNVQSGDRVANGQDVAIMLKESTINAMDDLNKKDLEILKLKNEKVKNMEVFSDDLSKIENEITNKAKMLVYSLNIYNTESIVDAKNTIDKLIAKKTDILGGTSSADERILKLQKEREQIQGMVTSQTKSITSPTTGVISFNVDGLEGVLTPSKLSKLTVKDLEKLVVAKSEIAANTINVQLEKPYAKLIKDIDAYFVGVVDSDKVSEYKDRLEKAKKTEQDVRISEIRISQTGKTIEGTVSFITNAENGKSLIAIKVSRGLSETADLRKLNIEIVKHAVKGLKVPVKSLMNIDEEQNTAQIMLLKANYAMNKKIVIIEKNEDFAIIENLPDEQKSITLYDQFLVNPQNIQEGQLIQK